jgi:hypothetical protein
MNSEIIENVANKNYDDFQHVKLLFSQKIISLDEKDKPSHVIYIPLPPSIPSTHSLTHKAKIQA